MRVGKDGKDGDEGERDQTDEEELVQLQLFNLFIRMNEFYLKLFLLPKLTKEKASPLSKV